MDGGMKKQRKISGCKNGMRIHEELKMLLQCGEGLIIRELHGCMQTVQQGAATADNSNMQDASSQDVCYREGESAGEPKYQTVHGNPFMQWAKLCPVVAETQ